MEEMVSQIDAKDNRKETLRSSARGKLFKTRYAYWQTMPFQQQFDALSKTRKKGWAYTVEQRALVCSLWTTSELQNTTKAKTLERIRCLQGFQNVSKQVISSWLSNKPQRKRGVQSTFEFEMQVLRECMLVRVESNGADDVQKLVVDVNLIFSYDVVKRAAKRVRDRYFKVDGEKIQIWKQHPRVKKLVFSDKVGWVGFRARAYAVLGCYIFKHLHS